MGRAVAKAGVGDYYRYYDERSARPMPRHIAIRCNFAEISQRCKRKRRRYHDMVRRRLMATTSFAISARAARKPSGCRRLRRCLSIARDEPRHRAFSHSLIITTRTCLSRHFERHEADERLPHKNATHGLGFAPAAARRSILYGHATITSFYGARASARRR